MEIEKFGNKLVAISVLGILALIGASMSRQAVADSTKDVVIDNVPLPVSGNVNVSGTVAATQSGPWNVGISGTPSVNIANTPTVNLLNSSTAPLHFLNVDEKGRIAYESRSDQTGICTGNLCNFSFPTIPVQHRLVVEHLSGAIDVQGVPTQVLVQMSSQSGGTITGFLPVLPSTPHVVPLDRAVLFYVDAGQSFSGTVIVNGTTFFERAEQVIIATGYLLDCQTTACAVIAQ